MAISLKRGIGPVAVTGANGLVGRAVVGRLARLVPDVRSLTRSGDLSAGLRGAEVIVHLEGEIVPNRPDTYASSNLGTVLAMLDAAPRTVRRVVFLSFAGAERTSPNEYLRAKAVAEDAIHMSLLPSVVLRANHIIGPPSRPGPLALSLAAHKGHVTTLGSGAQLLSPILSDDVAEVIASAVLDPLAPVGTFRLDGPDEMTMDELARLIVGPDVSIRHLPAPLARMLAHVDPELTPEFVDILLRDLPAGTDPVDTAGLFEVHLHHISQVWAGPRSLVGAA